MNSNNKITLAEARAAGFVIDYPAAPAGEGAPIGGLWGEPTDKLRAFDCFEKSDNTRLAGFLFKADGAHRVPCFLKGYNRADALADAKTSQR